MASEFEIREATEEDLDGIAQVVARAYDQLPLWKLMVKDMEPAMLHQLLLKFTTSRFEQPLYKYFVAVDINSGDIAGCTGLAIPTGQEEPPSNLGREWPLGTNVPLANHFFGPLVTQIKDYGYDGTKHFRRAGTFIPPEYQKKGLGTRLTRHCNRIADEAGRSTYLTAASDVALKMFLKEGFVELGRLETQLADFGGPDLLSRSYACRRGVKGD